MSVELVIFSQNPPPSRLENIRALIRSEAKKYDVSYGEIMSKDLQRGGTINCTKPVVQARFACMAAVRDAYGLSYPQLGKIFGRHHSTVLDGVRRHKEHYSQGYR